MQKLYGGQIRSQSGVVKTIRRATASRIPSVNSTVRKVQGSIDKVLNETAQVVESFLEPKLKSGMNEVKGVVKDTQVLFKEYPSRLTIVRLSEEVGKLDISKFSLDITTPSIVSSDDSSDSPVFDYGQEITVRWTADPKHSNKDWIGLYHVIQNSSDDVTKVSSKGRWSAVDTNGYENHIDTVKSNNGSYGEVVFKGDALFWEVGTYEFRYHVEGKHSCVAISKPFSIVAPKFTIPRSEPSSPGAEKYLSGQNETERHISQIDLPASVLGSQMLPVVQRIFVTSDYIPPLTIQESWDLEDIILTKRVAYAVKLMTGVELAPEVLQNDKNVGQLALRIEKAKTALRPFTAKKEQ